jgi:xanthine dehydrogenase accessory factor
MMSELTNLNHYFLEGKCPELSFRIPESDIVYKRRFQKPTRLIILGGGYVAQAICNFAAELEFEVIVNDDRPSFANRSLFPKATEIICDTFEHAIAKIGVSEDDFVTVVTRGHKHDADCLRSLLEEGAKMPFYLGMIGSKRRVLALFELLRNEGYDSEKLETVHAPIGLPIHAVTPEEIGISIVAQLIQCRRESWIRSNEVLDQTNADPRFLTFLEQPQEKVLAVVVERSGSTPVKTGAIMAVDRLGNSHGTIGGGCGEHEIVMKALQVFRHRKDCMAEINMSNDVAMEEGMVCGGTMKVALYYVPQAESASAETQQPEEGNISYGEYRRSYPGRGHVISNAGL